MRSGWEETNAVVTQAANPGGVPRARRAGRTAAHAGRHRASPQGLCRPARTDAAHPHPLGLGRRAATGLPRRRIEADMTDLTLLGIAEAGRLLARGDISATALTESFLKRIKEMDHKLASYITVTADMARNAARQADMELKGGVRRGPMHGIPVALKDIYETAGMLTTGHSHLRKDYVPEIDAESVRRLK